MQEKKEIRINKSIIKKVLISAMLSLIAFFIIEHFGKFLYTYYGGEQPYKTPLIKITYKTLLGNEVITDGKGMNYSDVQYSDSSFHKSYLNKLPYYLKAIKEDLIYFVILTILIFLFLYFRKKYSIKLT